MVYRVYVEKKPGLDEEARALLSDARSLLGISSLTGLRLFKRYDAENITPELFDYAKKSVFSEPQVDSVFDAPETGGAAVFAVEYLPGQFDQRADSAAQCIQIISRGERPRVRSAKVYALYGELSEEELAEIKKYVINPVEAREASLEKPETLALDYAVPTEVKSLPDFLTLDRAGLEDFVNRYGLAMDADDAAFCRDYFRSENRAPTITEIRVLDTYWSDHCRHTTFNTIIDSVRFEDPLLQSAYEDYVKTRAELGRTKPVCLMDLGTLAAKALKKAGKLDKLDESEEINACTVKIDVTVDGVKEPWLLLFKNETQPPHGDRALRRRGHLHRRRDSRPSLRQELRLRGHARHGRGRPHPPRERDAAGQAPAAQDRHHRGGGLFLLRQPDRPCHRRGR